MDNDNQTVIYNLVYVMVDTTNPLNTVVRVSSFSSEKAAEDALTREFDDIDVEQYEDEAILDCLKKENYGNNACIEFGYKLDDFAPQVEVSYSWRVAKTTIDLHAQDTAEAK